MNMIEKLVKSGYPRDIAEEIYKQYMEFEQISGNLDLDKIEDNKLNFDYRGGMTWPTNIIQTQDIIQ